MKIKTISRTEEDFVRKSSLDITKVHRNRDPVLHPFDRAREYTKALVATKLSKIFAKPFIGALDGHHDSVYCMSTVRNKIVPLISGSCDGEIKVWDLARQKCFWSTAAHGVNHLFFYSFHCQDIYYTLLLFYTSALIQPTGVCSRRLAGRTRANILLLRR